MRQITDVEQLEVGKWYFADKFDLVKCTQTGFLVGVDISIAILYTEGEKSPVERDIYGPVPYFEELQSLVRDAEKWRDISSVNFEGLLSMMAEQVDTPPEFAKTIDDNYMDLLGDNEEQPK